MKKRKEKIIKKILQKINCLLLFIIVECWAIQAILFIFNNCITTIK